MKRLHTILWWLQTELLLWTVFCFAVAQIGRAAGEAEVGWVTWSGVLSFVLLVPTVIATRSVKHHLRWRATDLKGSMRSLGKGLVLALASTPVAVVIAVVICVPAFTAVAL
jgi:hypothetical protein